MRKTVQIKIGGLQPSVRFDTDIELNIDDVVVVESPNGAEWGIVSVAPVVSKGRAGNNLVLRAACDEDMARIEKLRREADTALKIAYTRIEKYKLDMKLLSAHYTMDGGKVIIQFASSNRVDFRELVRDLAYSLRTRIELRQVSQRDEVKIAGALGPCGQICCCVRFKEDFENITVKMAKNQGLSLNPQKINGMCGRLLCCLAYENQTYTELNEKMPRQGSEVKTPEGRGVVHSCNVIKETVDVKFQDKDATRYKCYKLCELNGSCRSGG